jgi:branched-subunit amino acid aminotransferase/4-amino-4-deoxychorismate lyase
MGEGTTAPGARVTEVCAVAVAGRGLVDPREPVFAADDDALLRGRSVFETARVYGGRPFLLDRHLARFARSAERVGLPAPDAGECERLAGLVIGAGGEQDLALRLYWTGRTLVATVAEIDPELEAMRERGLRLVTVSWSTGALASAKSMSYAENMAAQDAAVAEGADDALLVGDDGTVLEAPTANVFWREGDRLLTPSLDLPILAGVTRALLLEIARHETVEGVFPLARLLEADEVFLCSSIREVMPVASVDGTPFGLGPAAHALQQALRDLAAPDRETR